MSSNQDDMVGQRYLVCVRHRGEFPVIQYGHWDHGNSLRGGARTRIFEFLKYHENVPLLTAGLENIFLPNKEEIKRFHSCVKERCIDYMHLDIDEADVWPILYPGLVTTTGADILAVIAKSTPMKKVPIVLWELAFMLNFSLCRATYIIDLDNQVLEIYEPRPTPRKFAAHRLRNLGPRRVTQVPEIIARFPFITLQKMKTSAEFLEAVWCASEENEHARKSYDWLNCFKPETPVPAPGTYDMAPRSEAEKAADNGCVLKAPSVNDIMLIQLPEY